MNQRVNELINQATITCMAIDPAHAVPASNLRFNKILVELIVQECLQISDEFEIDVNQSGLVSRIAQHFGVEE